MKCVRWIQGVLAARKVHLVPLLLCLNIKTLFMFVFVWASRPTKIMWTLQLHWPLWILRGCLIKVVGLWIRDRPWKCGRSAWFQLVYFACSSDQWMLPWVSFFAGCWPDVLQSFQFTLFFVGKRYETYFLDYVQNGGIAGKHDTILASIHSSQCFVVIYVLNWAYEAL